MIITIFRFIISILLSAASAIGGVMCSDTVVGTAFPGDLKQQKVPVKQQHRLEHEYLVSQQQQQPQITTNSIVAAGNEQQQLQQLQQNTNNNQTAAREQARRSISVGRHNDNVLQRRRIQMCKYFGAISLVAIGAALASWDRYPLVWWLRVQVAIVALCLLIRGPESLTRDDFVKIPLMTSFWLIVVDILILSGE